MLRSNRERGSIFVVAQARCVSKNGCHASQQADLLFARPRNGTLQPGSAVVAVPHHPGYFSRWLCLPEDSPLSPVSSVDGVFICRSSLPAIPPLPSNARHRPRDESSHVKVWSRALRSEGVTPKEAEGDQDAAEARARAAFGACVSAISAVDSLSYRFAEVRFL